MGRCVCVCSVKAFLTPGTWRNRAKSRHSFVMDYGVVSGCDGYTRKRWRRLTDCVFRTYVHPTVHGSVLCCFASCRVLSIGACACLVSRSAAADVAVLDSRYSCSMYV